MGKRSSFERRERDYYPTPIEAALPLGTHLLPYGKTFIEPCAGDGRLIDHLTSFGMKCVGAYDIEPKRDDIIKKDSLTLDYEDVSAADYIITNPPWDRDLLHKMITKFSLMKPTWLLFDADWMHTKQAGNLIKWCKEIVTVGRVKWIEGSRSVSKDNCAWYLFYSNSFEGPRFYGKQI